MEEATRKCDVCGRTVGRLVRPKFTVEYDGHNTVIGEVYGDYPILDSLDGAAMCQDCQATLAKALEEAARGTVNVIRARTGYSPDIKPQYGGDPGYQA